MNNTEEIKSCPACSNKETMIVSEHGFFMPGPFSRYWVECRNCRARGPKRQAITTAIVAYNAMPRREDFYTELMGMVEEWGPYPRAATYIHPKIIYNLAQKYAPEDSS